MQKNEPTEYENFDQTMRELLKVSHEEVKGKIDKDKADKKRKKAKQSSASREVSEKT